MEVDGGDRHSGEEDMRAGREKVKGDGQKREGRVWGGECGGGWMGRGTEEEGRTEG